MGSDVMTSPVHRPACAEIFDSSHEAIAEGDVHEAMGKLRRSLRELRSAFAGKNRAETCRPVPSPHVNFVPSAVVKVIDPRRINCCRK